MRVLKNFCCLVGNFLSGAFLRLSFSKAKKAAQNPLSISEGGYGKPLGHKGGTNLTNLLKIKFRDLGIRLIYKVERSDTTMKIIVVSARADNQVYKEAEKQRSKYDL